MHGSLSGIISRAVEVVDSLLSTILQLPKKLFIRIGGFGNLSELNLVDIHDILDNHDQFETQISSDGNTWMCCDGKHPR